MIKWLKYPLGLAGGAGLGYLWYHFFGCSSGCTISSSPINSMVYWGLFGIIIVYTSKK
jgi:hypothetical protein